LPVRPPRPPSNTCARGCDRSVDTSVSAPLATCMRPKASMPRMPGPSSATPPPTQANAHPGLHDQPRQPPRPPRQINSSVPPLSPVLSTHLHPQHTSIAAQSRSRSLWLSLTGETSISLGCYTGRGEGCRRCRCPSPSFSSSVNTPWFTSRYPRRFLPPELAEDDDIAEA
jgi:hypothetical protein